MTIKLLFLLVLTHGAVLFGLPNLTPHKDALSLDERIINNITDITAQKLRLEEKLFLVGTGGQTMHGVEMLSMDFDYGQEVDLVKARYLLVTAVRSYLDEINENKEVRRYLKKYPFTAANIEVGIYVHKPDGSDVPKDKLFFLSAFDGVLYYYLVNPKGYSRIVFHQETYDEAIALLHESI